MAPKHHPTPLSGGDRKALTKELGKARAMANILAAQSAEMRAKGEALIRQADRLVCEELERADVKRRRSDRSFALDRPGRQRRRSLEELGQCVRSAMPTLQSRTNWTSVRKVKEGEPPRTSAPRNADLREFDPAEVAL